MKIMNFKIIISGFFIMQKTFVRMSFVLFGFEQTGLVNQPLM